MQTVSQVRVIVLLVTQRHFSFIYTPWVTTILTPPPLKITGQAAQMIKPQEAFECNES